MLTKFRRSCKVKYAAYSSVCQIFCLIYSINTLILVISKLIMLDLHIISGIYLITLRLHKLSPCQKQNRNLNACVAWECLIPIPSKSKPPGFCRVNSLTPMIWSRRNTRCCVTSRLTVSPRSRRRRYSACRGQPSIRRKRLSLAEGLAGLLPRSRGPKGAHKLTAEVMAFIEEHLPNDGEMHARSLAQQIEAELGLSIHPRSIERAIMHKKKPASKVR